MTGDRGETCRRVGVTASYLYLEHEGFESAGPRAALKRAFVVRLISDQDEADTWLQMLDDRNLTSHRRSLNAAASRQREKQRSAADAGQD
jgi:Nucleotidyltransferase substrate binding protein like